MPDPPPSKRHPKLDFGELSRAAASATSRSHARSVIDPVRAAAGYAELHCRTNFSFLEGASHPDELVQRAAELGYRALAITDRNSLAGVVRAHVAAKEMRFKLLIGAEITPVDAPAAVLLATDRAAYGRLSIMPRLPRRRRRHPRRQSHRSRQRAAGEPR